MRILTLIYLLIVFDFTYPFCIRYFGLPKIGSMYVNSIVIGLLFLSWLKYPVKIHQKNNHYFVLKKYKKLFFFLFGWILTSSLFNDNHWFVIVKSIIEHYLPYIALFLIITRIKLSEKEDIKLIKLCYFLIILQIPVVLLQYFIGGYTNPDSMSGTIGSGLLGGTGINGVLGTFLFSVCLSRIMLTKITPSYLILGLLAFVPAIFGGSKFGVILIGVVVIVLLFSLAWIKGELNLRKISRYAVILFMFAVFIIGLFFIVIPEQRFAEFLNFQLLLDPKAVLAYDTDPGSRRILGYVILAKFIFKNWTDFLLGLGPGAMFFSKEFGAQANKNYETFFPLGAPDSIGFILTIGTIGLILVIISFMYGIVWVKDYLHIETCFFMRVTGYAFIPITVACLMSITYTLVWSSQAGLTYWVLTGVLVNRFGELVNNKESVNLLKLEGT